MARPKLKPTTFQRRLVEIAAGTGTPHDDIATALDISRSSLERHYGRELNSGACRRRILVIEAMYRAAIRGSAAAQKAYLAFEPQAPLPPAERVGKKDRAQLAAGSAQAGTEWEALLPHGKVN